MRFRLTHSRFSITVCSIRNLYFTIWPQEVYFLLFTRLNFAATVLPQRLLRLLCDPQKQHALNSVLRQDLLMPKGSIPFDCDGVDRNGTPVLFGYFLDFPRIDRFSTTLRLHKKKGIVICFDFQCDVLSYYSDKHITLQAISFEKFERSFFPSENANT